MSQEIDLGGTIYISSRRAAEVTGYAQDYIGQLARAGQIEARRVGGMWYVLEESLRGHKERADEFKPVPPQVQERQDIEASVAFDGRDYVSTARAARITGYSADYVGQLARSGKIVSRQVGSRWYVDRLALVEHKRHNDALLAAVQADSVGIARDLPQENQLAAEAVPEPHFTYISEASDLLPVVPKEETPEEELSETLSQAQTEIGSEEALETAEEVQHIPIRVVPEPRQRMPHEGAQAALESSLHRYVSTPRVAMLLMVFLGIVTFSFGGLWYLQSERTQGAVGQSGVLQVSSRAQADRLLGSAASVAENIFSKEIHFKR